jgi:hypothetical protein
MTGGRLPPPVLRTASPFRGRIYWLAATASIPSMAALRASPQ